MKYLAILAALVAGCTSGYHLEPQLAALKGKPIDAAISSLGIPSREYPIAGRVAYEWTSNVVNAFAPATAPALTCRVKVLAKDGIIEATEFQGSNGACYSFVRR